MKIDIWIFEMEFVLISINFQILVIFILLIIINLLSVATGREFPSILGHSGSIFVVFVVVNHGDLEPDINFYFLP